MKKHKIDLYPTIPDDAIGNIKGVVLFNITDPNAIWGTYTYTGTEKSLKRHYCTLRAITKWYDTDNLAGTYRIEDFYYAKFKDDPLTKVKIEKVGQGVYKITWRIGKDEIARGEGFLLTGKHFVVHFLGSSIQRIDLHFKRLRVQSIIHVFRSK